MQFLRAHAGDVYVAYHWKPTAGLLWMSADAQKVQIGGASITAWGPRQVGMHKKRKAMSKATIDEEGDNMTWVPPPTPKVAGKVEMPLEKALAVRMTLR